MRSFLASLSLGSKGGTADVQSADGTTIAVRRTGSGPPVVMVHGTLDGIGAWSFVEPPLSREFTLCVYDRRGRGGSGDNTLWDVQREVEDLAAVIAATGEPTHVVAHSFGAVVAMRAALDGVSMRSLVLYEPPMNAAAIPADRLDEITALVDGGELDDAIRTMAQDLAGVTDEEISVALSIPPVRKTLRDGVISAPREIGVLQQLTWDSLPIDGPPVLLVRGELSEVAAYPRRDQVDAIATNAEVADISGQRHLAHTFAPSNFTAVVGDFLRRH